MRTRGGTSRPIVFLGRQDSPILAHLASTERDLVSLGPSDPLSHEEVTRLRPRFVVSHGYRVILRADILDRLPDRIINLHISMLPFNRGADPVLWSVLEGTPLGVTIHYIDVGIDTGDVIAQRPVQWSENDTFASLYDRCTEDLARLFREQWPAILAGTCDRRPQNHPGTVHRIGDRQRVDHLLHNGWDTPIAPLLGASAH